MFRKKLAMCVLLTIALAACSAGPPMAPIGLNKVPANPSSNPIQK